MDPRSSSRAGYSAKSTGTCSVRVAMVKLAATWQLAILPIVPEYCRCTPTECVPCFGKPVSSMIQSVTELPSRHRRQRVARGLAAHVTVGPFRAPSEVRQPLVAALTPSGLGHARAAIGSMLFRSPSPSTPRRKWQTTLVATLTYTKS